MALKLKKYQPGAILHEAIMGAFHANGGTLHKWCMTNDVTPSVARGATFGQTRGPAAQVLLERIIEAAGPEFVEQNYTRRLAEHAAQFKAGAA